jgi:hypothetical protein
LVTSLKNNFLLTNKGAAGEAALFVLVSACEIHMFMRLTTAPVKISFATQLHTNTMKKIVAVVLVFLVLLNALILLPKISSDEECSKEECATSVRPKIELTEVNPGILPNLLKSTSLGF